MENLGKRAELIGEDFGYLEHGVYDGTHLMKNKDIAELEDLAKQEVTKRIVGMVEDMLTTTDCEYDMDTLEELKTRLETKDKLGGEL